MTRWRPTLPRPPPTNTKLGHYRIVTNGGAAPNVVPAHTSAKLRDPGSTRRIAAEGSPLL
jgi:hypothetical protein